MSPVNIETQGVVLWSRITEQGIKNDPSQYSTHDTKTVQLATTQTRVEEFVQAIADQVLPEWYINMSNLKNITKSDLDKVAKTVSEILKDPDPERIHNSLLAIKHVPTLAEEKPVTQKGTKTANVIVNEEWPSLPYIIKATAPAYEKDDKGIVVPGTFRPVPCDIYVDQRVRDEYLTQMKPNVPDDEWARLKAVFHDPDAWLDENLWGWRVIMLTGFKVSKGAAGLKVGFYPNKLSFHSKAKDYPASTAAGPASGDRQDDDL